MATASFEDFYEVPDLNFDISKLKDDLDKILKFFQFMMNILFELKYLTIKLNICTALIL